MQGGTSRPLIGFATAGAAALGVADNKLRVVDARSAA